MEAMVRAPESTHSHCRPTREEALQSIPVDIDAYCARIGYAGPRSPTLETLAAMCRCHPSSIPFENLSVAAGGIPELSIDALEAKLVRGGRGGYCYEQNSLLQAALVEIGFEVTGLSARVRYRLPPELETPRSHMVLCVEVPEGRFLVDSGFGGLTLTAPVAMHGHEPQPTPHETVRLVPAGSDRLLQARIDGRWVDVYRFDLAAHLPADYAMHNWSTATRPNSLFGNNLVATRPVAGGRHALFNRTLTWRPLEGVPERRQLQDAAALREALQDVFSIVVPESEFERAAEVASRGQAAHASFA
jgi:N-hydroxyarylamine O-acetyltransferase